jgi:hypothetical protein
MGRCFDCFAPTVGACVLPTALQIVERTAGGTGERVPRRAACRRYCQVPCHGSAACPRVRARTGS